MKIQIPIKSCLIAIWFLVTYGITFGQQVAMHTPNNVGTPTGMGYLEYLPPGYSASTALYPAIIFLHGSGERGDGTPGQVAKVANNGTPKFIKNGATMCFTVNGKTECFIVLSPQLATTQGSWKGFGLAFAQWALTNYRIDPDRLYLTGLSLGGNGTWVESWNPSNVQTLYAAIAPVSGWAGTTDGCAVATRKIPVWGFHGDKDGTVTLVNGQRPIDAMTPCNPNPGPIFTVIAGGTHSGNVWDPAYSPTHTYYNPNLYEWFLAHKRGVLLPAIPIVGCGADKTITLPISTTTFTANASDPDGTIVSTLWQQVSGPATATLGTPGNLLCIVSNLNVKGTYVFKLTATDNSGMTNTDQISVFVLPSATKTPPLANAGADKSITQPASTVTLTGSGTDSDGTIASYSWIQSSGPNTATLSGTTTTTLSASNLIPGSYTFTLTVTDNDALIGSDQVTVTVLSAPPNNPPVSNAGADKAITLPTNSTTLNGIGTDSDGTIASYLWVQTSGPSASTITPNNAGTTVVSNLIQGVYTYTLSVKDNANSTSNDQVTVTVLPIPPNSPPVANAGADIAIVLPTNTTTLNGSGTDSDGTIASYLWAQTSGPNTAIIASTSSASTGLSNLIAGNYLFILTVTDDKGSQSSDQVLVTVSPAPPNQPPVASAGTDISVTLPINSVSLTGNGSDSDGTIATYQWVQQNGPSASTIVSSSQKNTQINGLVAGVYTFELTVTDNNGATGSDQILVTVFPAANISPSANAGADQFITLPINSVTLNGTGSDTDGTITAFQWDQVSGPSVATFSNPTSANTTASGLTSGIYVFSLTVTDNNSATKADQLSVTVSPQPPNQLPIANAGLDQILTLPANSAVINGSGTDPDGTVVGYSWILSSGPTQWNVGAVDQPTLSISNLVQGIYVFGLTIVDDKGATATDEVKIFVNAPGQPPVSNAGSDKVITLPTNSITLSGSGTDPDGTITDYLWEQANGPGVSVINSPASLSTSITGLVQGIYVFNFWVTDNDGISDYDQVQVTVNPAPPNSPPSAVAGSDLTITLPLNSVSINGSGTDSDGTIASYLWSQVSGPGAATTSNLNQASITFSNLLAGTYVFRVTVTDDLGAKGQDDVSVKVNPQPTNIPPTANAGVDGQIILPVNSYSLNGSGIDSDGAISSYQWVQTYGPSIANLATPTNQNTNANNLVEGIYVFRLTVTDNKGTTGSDEVSITVKPIPANLPPISNAGGNKIITLPATSTTLNGSGSDQDGTIAGYNWSQISGPSIATTTSLVVSALTISNLIEGIYVFRLTVTDDKGSTGFDEVNIRVQPVPANQPPTANAGANKIVTLPINSSVFNGGGTDPDGSISSYSWTQASGPSTATLSGAATKNLTATNLLEGTYIFTLTVNDNIGDSGFDEVNIRVNPPLPNAPPLTDAGANLSIVLPINSKVIVGSATDSDGSIASYSWTQTLGPNSATFVGDNTNSLTASSLIEGIYVFRLTATDNLGESSFDEVQLTVNPAIPNIPPVADAGVDKTIVIPPNSIILNGLATDSDGTIATILWTQVSGPNNASFADATSLDLTINNLQVGTYIFRLQAFDNAGDSGLDEVTVFVLDNAPPIAFAGDPMSLTFPSSSVQLNGGGTDPDGIVVSYTWNQVSGPNTAQTSALDQQNLTVNGMVVGVYIFGLTIVDDKGAKAYSEVSITIKSSSGNATPTANAGEDIIITLPESSVLLSGQGTDSDGVIKTYSWAQISGPSTATISEPGLPEVIAGAFIEGTYIFELTVTDNGGLTASDQVTITVLPVDITAAKFPKIFSPNGDGANDVWRWDNVDIYQGCNLYIFNRFGKKVYEMSSYNNSWNGQSSDGQALEAEAYYYIIKCDGSKDITGGVRIVR